MRMAQQPRQATTAVWQAQALAPLQGSRALPRGLRQEQAPSPTHARARQSHEA